MNTFNPTQGISSRYAISNIVSNRYYQQISTGTTTPILIGNKGTDPLQQGYVYVPYIMMQNEPIMCDQDWREWQRQNLRNERKEKLEKIYNKK